MVQLRFVVALAGVLVALAAAPTAQASTCADYPTQAAAQKAHNTRDADGDGIFCEALPCPCLKARAPSAPAPRPSAPSVPKLAVPRLGRSIALHPIRRRGGCRVRGALSDPACTPGARYSKVT